MRATRPDTWRAAPASFGLAAALCAPGVAQASAAQAHLGAVNWWQWPAERLPMGWFLLDFAMFALIVATVAWRPIKQAMIERHQHIKKAIAHAAATHAKASQAHQAARAKLTTLEVELRELAEASLRDGEAERAQQISQARAYAERMQAEQQAQSDEATRRLQERLRMRLLGEVLREARQQVAQSVQSDDHVRLVDEAIAHLATAKPTLVAPAQEPR